MAFVGIGYTAEAGAHATGHHVLEAHLATDAALGGRASHGLHHRRGAAGVDDVVGGSKGGVGGNDAVVAERAIVGGYGDLGAGLEVLALGYIQRKGSIHPYDNGWGLYPTLSFRYREAGLRLSYWHGEGFIPILGPPLFSNASANTESLTIDRNRLLTLRLDYRWRRFKACEVTFEGELLHYFPWTGDRTGYGKLERDGRTLYGFGIHVKLNPSITLLR